MKPHEEKLVVENMKLVPFIFNKYYQQFRRSPDYEDILSFGYIGLMKAAMTYDPAKQYRFSTWATYHIRNEIRKYFREKSREMAERIISIDEERDNDGDEASLHEVIPALDRGIKGVENKLIVKELLSGLDERERTILFMYFWIGLSDKQIGKYFNLTRSRISQIINKSLRRLKARLFRKGIKKTDILSA